MDLISLPEDVAVRVEGLEYTYPDGTLALRGVDLLVRKGQTVALLGPNGAGKSTLALHINGILSGKGRVEVMGLEVNRKNIRRIRSMVGLVFQDPDDQLFSPTVYEDVAFGPRMSGLEPENVRQAVADALAQVGMEGSEERSPHHLSFGEKKRIALATVLSMEPEILVLDEPVSNLDPRGRRQFIHLLESLKATKIIITHDIAMSRDIAGRVVIMDGGKVVAEGRTSEVLRNGELLGKHGLI